MNTMNNQQLSVVPHIGTEVTGNRRFPRINLEEEFDACLLSSNGGTLFGLRRIGKSSEAAACCERMQANGMHVIKEDAQGKISEGELLLAILNQLPEKGARGRVAQMFLSEDTIAKVIRDTLSKFTGKPEEIQQYFSSIASVIERGIEKNDNIVLVIDEFPWLCRSILQSDGKNGRQRVDVLLAALRKWRTKGMRMLLMGSIGMVALGRQHELDLSHLNDMQPLYVPPLTREEAEEMCAALARGAKIHSWTPSHTETLLNETVALYPVMIQKGFQVLTLGGRVASLEKIPDLFADRVRPDFDASYYTQFDQRNRLYAGLPGQLSVVVPKILDFVFERGGVVLRDDIEQIFADSSSGSQISSADIGDALHILREDGFLAVRAALDGGQNWRIASGLVSAWKSQRRGKARR